MKSIFISFLTVFMCSFLIAKENLSMNYVITKNDTIISEKLNMGIYNTTYKQYNGKKGKISNNEIFKYSKNGTIFTKLPVYENNKPTGKFKFMELKLHSRGFDVYQLTQFNPNIEDIETKTYLFKNDKFMLSFTEKNKQSVYNFLVFK